MKKDKGTFGWIMEFAGQKRKFYLFSVICAVIGAVSQMIPFLAAVYIVGKLLSGDINFQGYLVAFLIEKVAT